MFVSDVPPEVPQLETPVIIVESHAEGDKHRTIGNCQVVENLAQPYTNYYNDIDPLFAVGNYFWMFENKEIGKDGEVTLLQGPQHGEFTVSGASSWTYLPNEDDYSGTDSATFLVEIGGYTVKLTYHIKAANSIGSGHEGAMRHERPENCPHGEFWKISPDGEITPLHRELKEHEKDEDRGSLENLLQETLATNQFNLSFDDLVNSGLGEANQKGQGQVLNREFKESRRHNTQL